MMPRRSKHRDYLAAIDEGALRAAAKLRPRCSLCGGNAGRLGPEGYHYLCRARADRGLPIVRLGDACHRCAGAGRLPRTAVGPINPSQATMDAWAPPCPRCAGTGVEPGTREDPSLPGVAENLGKLEPR